MAVKVLQAFLTFHRLFKFEKKMFKFSLMCVLKVYILNTQGRKLGVISNLNNINCT